MGKGGRKFMGFYLNSAAPGHYTKAKLRTLIL